jgi:hypothetical protein
LESNIDEKKKPLQQSTQQPMQKGGCVAGDSHSNGDRRVGSCYNWKNFLQQNILIGNYANLKWKFIGITFREIRERTDFYQAPNRTCLYVCMCTCIPFKHKFIVVCILGNVEQVIWW